MHDEVDEDGSYMSSGFLAEHASTMNRHGQQAPENQQPGEADLLGMFENEPMLSE